MAMGLLANPTGRARGNLMLQITATAAYAIIALMLVAAAACAVAPDGSTHQNGSGAPE